jgi:hypothetical protein
MLSDKTFLLFATKHYNNPNCYDIEEFNQDLSKLKYLKKIFQRYKDTGEINVRLALNYIITFYNVFGTYASTLMLFHKLTDHYDILKPFLLQLNYLPERVEVKGKTIKTYDILMNPDIVGKLRKI